MESFPKMEYSIGKVVSEIAKDKQKMNLLLYVNVWYDFRAAAPPKKLYPNLEPTIFTLGFCPRILRQGVVFW